MDVCSQRFLVRKRLLFGKIHPSGWEKAPFCNHMSRRRIQHGMQLCGGCTICPKAESDGIHLAAAFGTDAVGYRKYGLPKPSACTIQTSVEKQVTRNYPPTFIWYGRADRTVDPENSEMMVSALTENGVPYCLLSFFGVDHGVGLGEGLLCGSWFEEALNFWEIYRKGMQSYESN